MSIGDGKTDEVIFQFLNEHYANIAWTITVGKKQTEAKYYLKETSQVEDLLKDMAVQLEE